MPKAKNRKRALTPYEQRLHNNWLRRRKRLTPEPAPELTKEQMKLHWQDQAALDAEHRRIAEEEERARALKRVKLSQKKQVTDWLKSNDRQVNVQKLASDWERWAAVYRDKMLDVVVRYFAIADAGSQVNEALRYGMAMESATLDLKELNLMLIRQMRVEINALLLSDNTTLTTEQKEDVITRVIAREFPSKDNRVTLPKTRGPGQNPQSMLQNALKRELRKYESPS